jgi:thiamine biosynthesis protein ThiS
MITIDDKQMPWQQGMTLAQAMASLQDGYDYAVVRLNGKPVSRPNFSTVSVEFGAVIETLPLIAGG